MEDVATDIEELNKILKDHYSLHFARTGQEALEVAVALIPDMILLDIILPDMTGFAVLEKLKDIPETKDILVIIITGISSTQYEEKGLMLGAVDYITKPFHNAVVTARIRTHIRILQYIRAITQLGLHDALTGLPNRRYFDRQIAIEWARGCRDQTPLGLLMLDIDHFKTYNDTYGHVQGDVVLRETAKTLNGILKRPADLTARFGGEEFAVLLPNTELAGAKMVAEEIRIRIEAMRIPFQKDRKEHSITLCVGGAVMQPTRDVPYEELILEADKYLYQAKDSGRNRVCFK